MNWIRIEDGLPSGQYLMLTIDYDGHVYVDRFDVTPGYYTGGVFYDYLDDQKPIKGKVIAWQRWPEPYQPESSQ